METDENVRANLRAGWLSDFSLFHWGRIKTWTFMDWVDGMIKIEK